MTLKIIPSMSTETAISQRNQRLREIRKQYYHQSKLWLLDRFAEHTYITEQAHKTLSIQRRISTLR